MATTTVTVVPGPSPSVALLDGNPSADGTKALQLSPNDALQIVLGSGFPPDARISSVTFFPSGDENEATGAKIQIDASGKKTVNGTRSGDTSPSALYAVSWSPGASGVTQVTITNLDNSANPSAADSAWFAVAIRSDSSRQRWVMDPELVNTSGSQPVWTAPPSGTRPASALTISG